MWPFKKKEIGTSQRKEMWSSKREHPNCEECRYSKRGSRYAAPLICIHPEFMDHVLCVLQRYHHGKCGKKGKYFEPKEVKVDKAKPNADETVFLVIGILPAVTQISCATA